MARNSDLFLTMAVRRAKTFHRMLDESYVPRRGDVPGRSVKNSSRRGVVIVAHQNFFSSFPRQLSSKLVLINECPYTDDTWI